jgi:diguanylate cyclase (GGDEF)-like protein/PAS domain S-box-containing protein
MANRRRDELDSIFNALPDFYFNVDPKGTILDYRASSPSDIYSSPDDFLGRRMQDVLPEDVGEKFQREILQLRENKNPTSWEYPLTINGESCFFEARASAISHSDEIMIVVRNITQKKKDEDSLKLAASVFKHSSEGMIVTDTLGCIIDVNPAFTQISGYEKHEVVGFKTSKLSSGHHKQDFYRNMWVALKEQGHWEGEIYNKRKNGEVFPQWLSINGVLNERREVIQYVALYRDISEQKKATELIWKQAHYDNLTGLPNRNTLIDHMNHEIAKAKRNHTQVATFFLDLDEFKHINDTLGHDKGDRVLKQVSSRLLRLVRSEDIIARQGGDEFIIVIGNLNNTTPAIKVAEKLRTAFTEPFDLDGEMIYISVSIGISFYPQDGKNTVELLKTSDQAMYAAKASGKNCFHCFTKSMQDAAVQRMQLIRDLHLALKSNQFELYFQPIVSLVGERLHKAEAVIRWNHPRLGLVLPSAFIEVAEETRLISQIGQWVFEESCRSLKMLQQTFGDDFQLSINVSPVQFSDSNPGLVSWLEKLNEQNITASSLTVEITEGLLMVTEEEILTTLLNFRDAGIQVALDDFGTGYSSLAYIREYDIDYLKIDREFVRLLPDSTDSTILCESMIAMAHKLEIQVIAEGIETSAQEKALMDMGCDYGQGYLFSAPITLGEFVRLKREEITGQERR